MSNGTAGTYLATKEFFSPWLAGLLLIPGSLIILVLMAIVRISSRGPAIYRQVRVGRFGKHYTIYKLRTMCDGAELSTGPKWCSGNDDPRTTRIGRILRRLHLDELPQLINVVRGEMALVGPRPERPEFVEKLQRAIPGYLDRQTVLPGITGLAQIHLPPDTDLDCVRRKLVLDMHYIRTANIVTDLQVVACSFLRILGIPGHVAACWVALRRPPLVPYSGGLIQPDRAESSDHELAPMLPSSSSPIMERYPLADVCDGQEPSTNLAVGTD
jgi:lipopolysaccharide/colanic/teichoic acid biosynthesis glycosyltransferase